MSITAAEQRCNVLRQDLKAWEKKFAAENSGRKAGHDDIKADGEISRKYKEYNKLRGRLSAKPAPQTPSKRNSTRHPTTTVQRTPRAQSRHLTTTPVKRKREDHNGVEDVDPVAVLEITSPQGPAAIGPTPQRDGIVLGLFDLLPAGTPSRKRAVLADVEPNSLQTPSKGVQEGTSEASFESRIRAERTPQSSGKRFLLNQFATPKRIKLDEPGTPSSTLRNLATPSFLRRDNVLTAIDEIDEPTPRPAPWKRRPLGRSLSAMIQAMKKDEDDRLDEEADIMRELEMEEDGIPVPRKPKVEIQVEDSQAQMPLGPDRGQESDEESEEEPATGADGKPRQWKKKGLKRQTRRVIMRPNFAKPKPPPTVQNVKESGDEMGNKDDAEDADSNYDSDASHQPGRPGKKPTKTNDQQKGQDKTVKEGITKTAVRKIKATANANYQRLKIRGKGSNGGKGKFSRRR